MCWVFVEPCPTHAVVRCVADADVGWWLGVSLKRQVGQFASLLARLCAQIHDFNFIWMGDCVVTSGGLLGVVAA